jgi:hypothetical protein
VDREGKGLADIRIFRRRLNFMVLFSENIEKAPTFG